MKNFQYLEEYKDMFNIYKLITKIDKGYRLYFDKKNKEYLILNLAKNNEICLKTRFLSPEITILLIKSRIENINKIIKEVDDNNDYLTYKNNERVKNDLKDKMKECLNFSKRATAISKTSINKIIGEVL